AKWTPHYDVRVADISQPVDLRYRAKVSQQSGEDWTDVRLKLSTGDPTASGAAPELETWRLFPGARPPAYRPEVKQEVAFGYRTVSGVVTDENGEPLIGASIFTPGMSTGTVTDLDGRYSIQVPASTRELTVSYTGFNSQQVLIQAGRNDVRLNEDGVELDEVVVTGYAGRRQRSDKSKRIRGQASLGVADRELAPKPSAPVPVQTERRATTVNFDIELPYTIPTDGKARDVEIKQHALSATYTHLAVPKFTPDAYLTAAVTDWEQYDLLSGTVQLFFEGTYLGDSQLDVANTTDTLELSLGKDPNIVVERKPWEEYRERSPLGFKTTDSRGYRITVRNKKDQPVNLTIMDQIPVSADESIDVREELEDAWRLDEETGLLRWEVRLAPQEEQKAAFGYTVKYPRGRRVLLE
ncbi:MAG: mucoidy inhibitor MuiA family protein, partial [Bacteroidota bacterium]